MITDAVGGAALLLKGLRFLVQRPKLFWLGAVPPFIMSVIFAVLLVLLITKLSVIADAITPFADGWAEAARTAMQVLAGAGVLGVTLLVMIISFSTLTMALRCADLRQDQRRRRRRALRGPAGPRRAVDQLAAAGAPSVGRADRDLGGRGAAAVPGPVHPGGGPDRHPRRRGVLRRLDARLRADRAELRTSRHPDAGPASSRHAASPLASARLLRTVLPAARHPVRRRRGLPGGHGGWGVPDARAAGLARDATGDTAT